MRRLSGPVSPAFGAFKAVTAGFSAGEAEGFENLP